METVNEKCTSFARYLSGHWQFGWQAQNLTVAILAPMVMIVSAVLNHAYGFSAPFQTEGIFNVDHSNEGVVRVITSYTTLEGKTTVNLPELDTSYRFNDNVGIGIEFPFQLVTQQGATNYDFGSTAFELEYRIYDNKDSSGPPSIGIDPQLRMPSPASQYGLGTGYVNAYLPLILEKDIGKWSMIGNLAAGINPGDGNKSYAFTGFALSHPITKNVSLGGELYYQSPDKTGLKNTIAFDIGIKYSISKKQDLYFSAGRGIINGNNTNKFTSYLVYQISF